MVKGKKIVVYPEDSYRKRYSIRQSSLSHKYHEITVPFEVIEKQARERGMTVDRFVKNFDVEYLYNSFLGVHLKFIKKRGVKV